MFRWLSKVLHWRQTSAAVTEGRQTQFLPYEGVYVMAHQLPACKKAATCGQTGTDATTAATPATVPVGSPTGSAALIILNGTDKPQTFHAERYKELWPASQQGTITAREVTSGRRYDITQDIKLSPRQTLLLEY